MTIGKVTIQYGFSPEDKVTLIKYFRTGDSSSKTGPGGSEDFADIMLVPADHAPVTSLQTWVENYVACLSRVCQPGVQILTATGEQFSDAGDWGSVSLLASASYDIVGFTPKVGNTARKGPRGRAFIGARQKIPATNRFGWLRWHYLAGNLMTLPTLCSPSDIDSTFASYYANLRDFGGSIDGYSTLTATLDAALMQTNQDLPSGTLQVGIRNG